MGFLITLFSTMVVQNVVLVGYKGLCSYLGITKKPASAFGMGVALIFVSFFAGLIAWGLGFVLDMLNIGFMATVIDILVIASLVQLVELIIKRFFPSLYESLGVYLPLITTNCVILYIALAVTSYSGAEWYNVLATVLGVPCGYFMIIMIFSAIRDRLDNVPVLKSFKGAAIGLVCTAIMAMAFMGFVGIV